MTAGIIFGAVALIAMGVMALAYLLVNALVKIGVLQDD